MIFFHANLTKFIKAFTSSNLQPVSNLAHYASQVDALLCSALRCIEYVC